MKRKGKAAFDAHGLITAVAEGRTTREYRKSEVVFSQGDPADAVFFGERGKVKFDGPVRAGQTGVIGLLGPGAFFGEGCLAGQPLRMATAIALTECSIIRLAKQTMIRALHRDPVFAEMFTTYLLSRNIRMEEDLVDQLFNSSEKRLARRSCVRNERGREDGDVGHL